MGVSETRARHCGICGETGRNAHNFEKDVGVSQEDDSE